MSSPRSTIDLRQNNHSKDKSLPPGNDFRICTKLRIFSVPVFREFYCSGVLVLLIAIAGVSDQFDRAEEAFFAQFGVAEHFTSGLFMHY